MNKNYYCNTLVMKHHLNTSTYQKMDWDSRLSKKIVEEINKSDNICVNMQPPEDLKDLL